MRWAVAVVPLWLALGCGSSAVSEPTGTVCPTPDPLTLTWDNFGHAFMTKYCTVCHDSSLPRSQRNGAPIYHDFDTEIGVLNVADHVDEYTGSGPLAHNTRMPSSRCPSTPGGPLTIDCPVPSDDERMQLSLWLACDKLRAH